MLLIAAMAQTESIYDLEIRELSVKASFVKLSQFKGKQLLIINTASAHESMQEIIKLRRLNKSFSSDKLVILLCPSNSFGLEPGDVNHIRNNYKSIANPYCRIVMPMEVKGSQIHPLYRWLADKERNGKMSIQIPGDFTKVLISKEGQIAGYFSSQVKLSDPVLMNALLVN